jgi:hypothetical protein
MAYRCCLRLSASRSCCWERRRCWSRSITTRVRRARHTIRLGLLVWRALQPSPNAPEHAVGRQAGARPGMSLQLGWFRRARDGAQCRWSLRSVAIVSICGVRLANPCRRAVWTCLAVAPAPQQGSHTEAWVEIESPPVQLVRVPSRASCAVPSTMTGRRRSYRRNDSAGRVAGLRQGSPGRGLVVAPTLTSCTSDRFDYFESWLASLLEKSRNRFGEPAATGVYL